MPPFIHSFFNENSAQKYPDLNVDDKKRFTLKIQLFHQVIYEHPGEDTSVKYERQGVDFFRSLAA